MECKQTIGVVIVNYNGEKYQNECIDCILKQTYNNYRIIVVDNKSKDNSMNMLDRYGDKVIKIYNESNLGITEGNNIGIKKSIELGCEYTLLLNNDTLFEDDLFEKLIQKSKEYSIVVPKIYFFNSSNIWYVSGYYSKIRCTSKHRFFMQKEKQNMYKDYCDYSPTCCMLLKNDVFDKVGFMDNDYFLYYDDTDFCMRLKNKGYRIGIVNNIRFYHLVSMSSGKSSKTSIYYMFRNKLIFMKKNKTNFFFFFRWMNRVLSNIKLILFWITDKEKYSICLKAYKDFKNKNYGRCDDL